MGALSLTVLSLAVAGAASARILKPWGSTLAATPTLDTANGASHANGGRPIRHGVTPLTHDGADLAIWNTRVTGGSARATHGGQVRAIRVKGCAVEDLAAPAQVSLGVPVNTIEFQTLTRQANGSYKSDVTAGTFQLPFCSNSEKPATGKTSTRTVTTFTPIHMCIANGDTVDLYGLGGFVPSTIGFPWYPQGVPLEVLAASRRSSMSSFLDADISGGVYAPGARPRGANSGWGVEPGEQLMLQVVEGVAGDAYGLCPGGGADEPTTSNKVLCDYHAPYSGHLECGQAARPRRRSVT